jgi:choline-glycine betaine transporter
LIFALGMFIAKISRGRTIRSFINGTITIPVVYSFMWMVLFGGIGIRQERAAGQIGLCCKDDANWFISLDNDTILSDAAPSDIKDTLSAFIIDIDPQESSWVCEGGQCGACATTTIKNHNGTLLSDFVSEYTNLGNDFGSTSADRQIVMLSCHSTEQMWFDVMRSYLGVGQFLSIFSLFAIILYFVTSSDSGSLVIDCLSANGDPDPPRIQRVFWAFMEGATATALLVAGGKKGLAALQTAGIVSGLPYTVVICLLCTATWRAVKVAAGDLDPHGPTFACGLFDMLMAEPRKK